MKNLDRNDIIKLFYLLFLVMYLLYTPKNQKENLIDLKNKIYRVSNVVSDFRNQVFQQHTVFRDPQYKDLNESINKLDGYFNNCADTLFDSDNQVNWYEDFRLLNFIEKIEDAANIYNRLKISDIEYDQTFSFNKRALRDLPSDFAGVSLALDKLRFQLDATAKVFWNRLIIVSDSRMTISSPTNSIFSGMQYQADASVATISNENVKFKILSSPQGLSIDNGKVLFRPSLGIQEKEPKEFSYKLAGDFETINGGNIYVESDETRVFVFRPSFTIKPTRIYKNCLNTVQISSAYLNMPGNSIVFDVFEGAQLDKRNLLMSTINSVFQINDPSVDEIIVAGKIPSAKSIDYFLTRKITAIPPPLPEFFFESNNRRLDNEETINSNWSLRLKYVVEDVEFIESCPDDALYTVYAKIWGQKAAVTYEPIWRYIMPTGASESAISRALSRIDDNNSINRIHLNNIIEDDVDRINIKIEKVIHVNQRGALLTLNLSPRLFTFRVKNDQ